MAGVDWLFKDAEVFVKFSEYFDFWSKLLRNKLVLNEGGGRREEGGGRREEGVREEGVREEGGGRREEGRREEGRREGGREEGGEVMEFYLERLLGFASLLKRGPDKSIGSCCDICCFCLFWRSIFSSNNSSYWRCRTCSCLSISSSSSGTLSLYCC